ncbi:MAG TPA: FAD-dependent oxidoreductase [Gaiellaceae bacterium]|nr:FAD-dependent oxidoreductase [Gaiellaceae bacterium]
MKVVAAGAGVAGLELALALRALAEDAVTVELVAPETEFVYRPLAVAEPFRTDDVRRFGLERLVEAAGASLRPGRVTRVEPERKQAVVDDGEAVDYDAFVLAVGAGTHDAIDGALTFRGPQDDPALAGLLERATDGELRRIAFVVPAGISWPLPMYELALQTGTYLSDHVTRGVELVLVTAEEHPLGVFGREASSAIAELLEIRGIEVEPGLAAMAWHDGVLAVAGDVSIEADAVVALPQLVGPALPRLPHDRLGFVPTDLEGRVTGLTDVYAAGDATQFRPKQGGLATQQADAVAAAIARDAGADVAPMPFRPVLRGVLLTGFVPRFLRADIREGTSVVDTEALWWPPAKIVGHYLAPFLAAELGLSSELPESARRGAVEIEVELDPHSASAHTGV